MPMKYPSPPLLPGPHRIKNSDVEKSLFNISTDCLAASIIDRRSSPSLIKKFSSFYISYPFGYKDQNYFYNTAIELETNLEPRILFDELQLIEKRLQKNKQFLNGPRRIDLDIIFFNKLVLTSNFLTIPHKSAHKRDFVLLPLIEISPFYIHPTKKVPIKKLQKDIKKNYVFKVIRRQQESLVIY